jgi:hypothetical protein
MREESANVRAALVPHTIRLNRLEAERIGATAPGVRSAPPSGNAAALYQGNIQECVGPRFTSPDLGNKPTPPALL